MRRQQKSCRFNGKELDEETGLYYFGARYFDPKYVLWYGTDPLQEKYPWVSSYCYTMGNPVKLIDSDGRLVLFAKGSSNGFKLLFKKTVKYMNQHGVGNYLYELNKSPNVYYIAESKNVHNSFDYNTKTIEWNPFIGVWTEEDLFLSPITLLNHEIGHALNYDNDPSEFKSNIQNLPDNHPDNLFGSLEEKNVINGPERITAKALGEVQGDRSTRTSHSGKFFDVDSPTSNKPLNEKEIYEAVIFPQNSNKNE